MKRTQMLVLSVLFSGVQGIAMADSPYPADAEASYNLAASETYADRNGGGESSAPWGVSKRAQPVDRFLEMFDINDSTFPSRGGPLDD